ncbi:MAG: protein adenylyltransferase SelO family protein [Bdellovibrionota bacterium]
MLFRFFLQFSVLLCLALPVFAANGEEAAWKRLEAGEHSLLTEITEPGFYEEVPVRPNTGEILLFNFDLAKELGLMPASAPNVLTPELAEKVNAAFGIEVAPKGTVGTGNRIATYYNDGGLDYNSGRGDGRALWIADIKAPNGRTYDVTTKGTGGTGLGYLNYPGHSDGLVNLSEGFVEYNTGESFYRSGISDASRVLAVSRRKEIKTLVDGVKVESGTIVRVSPSNLRFAHIWQHGKDPENLKKLLSYYFAREPKYQGLAFTEAVHQLLLDNIQTSARQAAILENNLIMHGSPTRGNRLISGDLIDYGTVQFFDRNYADFYENKSLGSFEQQRDFALHWNELLKTKAALFTDVSAIDVKDIFESEYAIQHRDLNLLRIGLSEEDANWLKAQRPDLADKISSALNELRRLQTRDPVKIGKIRLRMPVLDSRNFLAQLPWSRLAGTETSSILDGRKVLKEFGSPGPTAPFNFKRLSRALESLEPALKETLSLLAAEHSTAAPAVAKALEVRANERNGKIRSRGLRSRVSDRVEIEKLFAQKPSPERLGRFLDEKVEASVDIRLANDIRSPSGSYALWDYYHRLASGDIKLPQARGPPLPADLPADIRKLSAIEVLRKAKLAAWISPNYPIISEMLKAGEQFPDENFQRMLVNDLIRHFGSELQWDAKTTEETIRLKVQREHLPLLKSWTINSGPTEITIESHGDGEFYSQVGKDKSGKIVLLDGPRRIYRQKSTGRLALSSSILSTEVSAELRNSGLYKAVLDDYVNMLPEVKVFALNSENTEMLEFHAKLERLFASERSRATLLENKAIAVYLAENGVDLKALHAGTSEVVSAAKELLLFLSLQGRTRLKIGLGFEADKKNFGSYWSMRLSPEQAEKKLESMQKLESFLRKEELSSLRKIFPESYLDNLNRKSRVRQSCTESYRSLVANLDRLAK